MSAPLHERIRLVRGLSRSRWGYFLRAETMHGLLTFLEQNPGADGRYHERSHGQAFTELLDTADAGPSAPDVDPVERARRRRRRLRAGITTAVAALVIMGLAGGYAAYALTTLTADDEVRIADLIRRAAG